MFSNEIFYAIFLISALSIIWFYTDSALWYSQLFNIFSTFRLEYGSFINQHPEKYFPDFLYYKGTKSQNRLMKFLFKLISCPFCLIAWLSIISASALDSIQSVGVIYVCSLYIVLLIKKLI